MPRREALEPKKRKEMAATNVALGQRADVSRAATDAVVVFTPTTSRCTSVLRDLAAARTRNHLSPGEAAHLRGRLGWVLSAAYARVGRAACQPLVERESKLMN